jgi:hypothetical protein
MAQPELIAENTNQQKRDKSPLCLSFLLPVSWYQLSPKFVFQTWTQTVRAALLPSAFPAFLPPSRRLWDQVMSLRAGRPGRAPFGPTLAPPPYSCLLTRRRAWPGSVGLPSPGFSPATCSRRGRDGPARQPLSSTRAEGDAFLAVRGCQCHSR